MMSPDEARQEAVRLLVGLLEEADDLLIYLPEEDREPVADALQIIRDELEGRAAHA